MKFSAAISLGIAPVALAKAVHNVYPVRRDPSKHNGESKSIARQFGAGVGTVGVDPLLLAQAGLILGDRQEVVVIWINGGNNAATTTINAQSTVTQTVTAGQVGVGGQQVAAGAPATLAPLGEAPTAGQTGQQLAPLASGAAPTVGANGAQTTHVVTLGGPKGLSFQPDSIKANVGDMVIFTYLSQNHTATQSAFGTPCLPLSGGMDSGFQANPNNTVNPPPQVAMQVMVDTPLWFFCAQNGHCGKGMTFSINPTAAKTQAMFQQLAIAQNGTGGGSAITGGQGPPPAEVPAGQSIAAPAGQAALTGTLGTLPSETLGALAPAGTGVVAGSGTLLGDGSCQCAVDCGAGAFPAVQAQGLGNFGGMAGALPSSMVAVR